MIARRNLQKYTKILGYSLGQVEKDYLQHLLLFYVYAENSIDLVFKGGTALQKCFGLDRFSEDLDFTYQEDYKKLEKIFKAVQKSIELFYKVELHSNKNEAGKNSVSYVFKIKGPLYTGKPISECNLRIDISMREPVMQKPKIQRIIPIYDVLRPYTVYKMTEEEILAEKVRALCKRQKARDLYDIWFLMSKKVPINAELVQTKMNYYSMKLTNTLLEEKVQEKEKIWSKELTTILKNVPEYSLVSKEVLEKMLNK